MATDNQKRLLQNLDTNTEAKEIQFIHEQIKTAHSTQIKVAFIRARMKYWPENKDLPDSILQYEKTKQTNQFSEIDNNTNSIAICDFFTKIWSETPPRMSDENYLCDISLLNPQLQSNQHPSLFISKEEIQSSINSFREKTSPGSDGLPIKFYKTMPPDICLKLSEIYNIIY